MSCCSRPNNRSCGWSNRWRRCCRFCRNRRCRRSWLRNWGRWSNRWRYWLRGYGRRCRCHRRSDHYRSGRSNDNGRWRWSNDSRLHARCFGGCFFRDLFRCGVFFSGDLSIGHITEMFAHPYGGVDIDGTRVGLLFCNTGFRQIIDDRLGLDLELARQFVDANLIRFCHCPPGLLLAPIVATVVTTIVRRFRCFGGIGGW